MGPFGFTARAAYGFPWRMDYAPARRVLLGLAMLLCGVSCAAPKAPLACPSGRATIRSAKVFYATDRRQEPTTGKLQFGPRRADPPSLHMGWEQVTIGPQHRLGKVDAAMKITGTHEEQRPFGSASAGTLQRSDEEIVNFMETRLRAAIRSSPPPHPGKPRQVLVFIHGYNTSFNYAVLKTAQLAGDLELVSCDGETRGVAIAYSWPAQGTLLSYFADEENAEWTQQRLAPFLLALANICKQERAELHLIAHSMGARALVRSLADVANSSLQKNRNHKLADHVILLAADIGEGLFTQYVQRFLPLIDHLTIYVSSKDRALRFSTFLHGGHRRLGLVGSSVAAALEFIGISRGGHRELGYATAQEGTAGKIDMIDVSNSFASTYGHIYEGPAFIHDLRELIHNDTPAGTGGRSNLERGYLQRSPDGSTEKTRYFQLRNKGS